MTILILLLATLVLLLLNAFFVLAEFAAVKIRPSRVEELVDSGDARAKLVKHIQKHLDEYLAVCQVGITLCSIALGFLGEPAIARLIEVAVGSKVIAHGFAIGIAYVVISFLHVVIGEQVAKMVAIYRPERAALWMARPLEFFRILFFVPLKTLNQSTNAVLWLLGIRAKLHEPAHTEQELRILLEQSQTTGMMSFRRLLLLENIFDLGDLKVRDAMRGRSAAKVLRTDAPWEENLRTIRESHFSRFPVVEPNTELPVGVVHIKDFLDIGLENMVAVDLKSLGRRVVTTTEDAPLEALLPELQHRRAHLAVVLNKEGKWTGVISLEDVIEEIVGAIEDEFAADSPLFLADVLNEKRIALDVQAASLTDAIPQILARIPPGELPLPAEKIAKAVLERESAMSTYLGHGLATPHARLEIEKALLIFARSDSGIAISGQTEKVHLIFILLTPASFPRTQVRLLARIAGLMTSEFMAERLREAETPQAILEAIRAGDPMALR